jgi:hypothetical protein
VVHEEHGTDHSTDHSTAGLSAERIARNDAIFRKANEGISGVAEAAEFAQPIPFICECADPLCRDMVVMTLTDYQAIRQDPTTFLNVPGHQVSSQGWAQVIENHDTYVVVAKIGPAAKVAEQLEGEEDPATAPVDIDR